MSPHADVGATRTLCPECGFEVPIADDCSLCGHDLDVATSE
jgi:uncharacterized protein (DUF983 family)